MTQVPSGFEVAPSLSWGCHITQFYSTGDELRDVLVPYFKAGLENNERCLWVTGGAFDAGEARAALRSVVPDFDAREAAEQIAIHDAQRWYAAGKKLQPQTIVDGLMQAERDALAAGYKGLRTSGNCAWVERGQWKDFQAYEALVQQAVRGRRMICLCSYCTSQLRGSDLMAVMDHHDFALSPRRLRARIAATPTPSHAR
ncbi:MAG: MEDS domain-containing protein [Xanthobacteraceae bacterium]|nr:MEDS domain-containing protein [Xanthobacteraceae bacterium]